MDKLKNELLGKITELEDKIRKNEAEIIALQQKVYKRSLIRRVLGRIFSPIKKLSKFLINLLRPIKTGIKNIILNSKMYKIYKQLPHVSMFMKLLLATIIKHPKVKNPKAKGKKILMLTISQIEIDPRINKVARGLAEKGFKIVIICFLRSIEFPEIEHPFPGVTYRRVPLNDLRHSFQIYFQETIFRAGIEEECDIVYSNDFTTLLVGWMLSRRKKIPLVYDAHEMWTENVEYDGKKKEYVSMPKWKRFLFTQIEKRMVYNSQLFVSVSNQICKEFKRRYKLEKEPFLLPNFPELALQKKEGLRTIRERFNLPEDYFIILYIGGINPARNIESVILSLKYLPEKCIFAIQGPGVAYYQEEYKKLAATINAEDRILCLEGVKQHQVVEAASFADCGVLMLKNLCLNFYWFYPNKFFEYMMAGIPVAVSNFPEVSAHVEKEGCGVTFAPHNPKSIAESILWLYNNRAEAKKMGERGKKSVLEKYNWEAIFEDYVKEIGKL